MRAQWQARSCDLISLLIVGGALIALGVALSGADIVKTLLIVFGGCILLACCAGIVTGASKQPATVAATV